MNVKFKLINHTSAQFHKINEYKQLFNNEIQQIANINNPYKYIANHISNFYECDSSSVFDTDANLQITAIFNSNLVNKYFIIIEDTFINLFYMHNLDGLSVEMVFKIQLI